MSAPVSDLLDLKRRIEEAKGPSGALDSRLEIALAPIPEFARAAAELIPHDNGEVQAGKNGPRYHAPEYTYSIDAALTLVERALPGFGYSLTYGPGDRIVTGAVIKPPVAPDASITDGRSWAQHFNASAPTPALALIFALVNALIAQQEKADG